MEIEAASIDTGQAQRDEHLRSGDFFDVERFPKLSFRSTRVEHVGDGRLRVQGDLTIRDVTKQVVLQVTETQPVMATHPLNVDSLLSEAGDQPFVAAPAETRIGHVHLHVRELAVAAGFYHEALGLDKVVWNYPGALFLSAGGYHHHLGLNTWATAAPIPEADDAQLLSWALVLPNEPALERATENLESAGHPVTHEDGRVLARDPWGTSVALVTEPGARQRQGA